MASPSQSLNAAWAMGRCATAGLFAALGSVLSRSAGAGGDPSANVLWEGSPLTGPSLVTQEGPVALETSTFEQPAATTGPSLVTGFVTSFALFALRAWPLLCALGVVLCNVAMWALYISGMDAISSLQATVLNSSSNIAFSGLLGHFLLKEKVTGRWIAGVACICGGLLLLTLGTQPEEEGSSSQSGKSKTE